MSKLFAKHKAKLRSNKLRSKKKSSEKAQGDALPVRVNPPDLVSNGKSVLQKPLNTIALDVFALSHEGRGIAKHKGKTQFVDNALPGETVYAEIKSHKANFDELLAVDILTPSKSRVEPFCEYFKRCGGCSMQHLAIDEQLKHKEGVLLEHLQNIAGVKPVDVLPALRGPDQHYRSRAKLSVDPRRSEISLFAGFREKQSNNILDIERCDVLDACLSSIAQFKDLIFEHIPVKAIGHIELIENHAAPALVIRLTKDIDRNRIERLYRETKARGWCLYIQYKEDEAPAIHTSGEPADNEALLLEYVIESSQADQGGLTLRYHPRDFTQVNRKMNQAMIERVLSLLALENDQKVLDLFCGLGNFSLPISLYCKHVVGVEGSRQSVELAQQNAELNGIENSEFYCADLFVDLNDQPWFGDYDQIVLDPPRAGALHIAKTISSLNAKRIVYISCNPATLARDSAEIVKQGYCLSKAGVMDMFPHTAHIESVAVFDRV